MNWIRDNVPESDWDSFLENDYPIALSMKFIPKGAGGVKSSQPDLGIPHRIVDLLQSGFSMGGLVSPDIMRYLDLSGRNYSLVADSQLYTGGLAYPFYKEKRAGQPTGHIMFVRGYPIDKFLRLISK